MHIFYIPVTHFTSLQWDLHDMIKRKWTHAITLGLLKPAEVDTASSSSSSSPPLAFYMALLPGLETAEEEEDLQQMIDQARHITYQQFTQKWLKTTSDKCMFTEPLLETLLFLQAHGIDAVVFNLVSVKALSVGGGAGVPISGLAVMPILYSLVTSALPDGVSLRGRLFDLTVLPHCDFPVHMVFQLCTYLMLLSTVLILNDIVPVDGLPFQSLAFEVDTMPGNLLIYTARKQQANDGVITMIDKRTGCSIRHDMMHHSRVLSLLVWSTWGITASTVCMWCGLQQKLNMHGKACCATCLTPWAHQVSLPESFTIKLQLRPRVFH